MKTILLTGGARSGKSHYAQELALKLDQPVLFVATAEAGDEEMKQRIEAHRKARPSSWTTLEATTHIGSHIPPKIDKAQTVVVDCITLLINNIFASYSSSDYEQIDASLIEKEIIAEIDELIACIETTNANFIIVTNEVGLGLVPPNKLGRLYRDFLGKANQILAQSADEVYLMVAGLPLPVKTANSDE